MDGAETPANVPGVAMTSDAVVGLLEGGSDTATDKGAVAGGTKAHVPTGGTADDSAQAEERPVDSPDVPEQDPTPGEAETPPEEPAGAEAEGDEPDPFADMDLAALPDDVRTVTERVQKTEQGIRKWRARLAADSKAGNEREAALNAREAKVTRAAQELLDYARTNGMVDARLEAAGVTGSRRAADAEADPFADDVDGSKAEEEIPDALVTKMLAHPKLKPLVEAMRLREETTARERQQSQEAAETERQDAFFGEQADSHGVADPAGIVPAGDYLETYWARARRTNKTLTVEQAAKDLSKRQRGVKVGTQSTPGVAQKASPKVLGGKGSGVPTVGGALSRLDSPESKREVAALLSGVRY